MSDFVIENNALYEYKGRKTRIVLPEQVEKIKPFALSCTKVKSVIINQGVKYIGRFAFLSCPIREITLPRSVEFVSELAFSGCESLERVVIQSNDTSISQRVFHNCPAIRKIEAPEGFDRSGVWYLNRFDKDVVYLFGLEHLDKDKRLVKHITKNKREAIDVLVKAQRIDLIDKLLEKSQKIKLEELNDLIEYSGKHKSPELNGILLNYKNTHFTSDDEEKLQRVNMEKSLGLKRLSISDYKKLFKFFVKDGKIRIVDMLTEDPVVEIPEMIGKSQVTEISDSAFYGCDFLTDITIPKTVEVIGEKAFAECVNLTNVRLEGKIKSIEDFAFWGCESLKAIHLLNGVKRLGEGVFENSGITTIEISSSTRRIEDYTFRDCKNLTSIKIGKNIKYISKKSFEGCDNLTEILVDERNNSYLSIEGVLFSKDKSSLIMCPPNKSEQNYNIPEGTLEITRGAFSHCDGLTRVTLPKSLEMISKEAFKNCKNLRSIKIGKNVCGIAGSALEGCDSLEEISVDPSNPCYCTIDNVLYSEGKRNLMLCAKKSNLKSICIPGSVQDIYIGAFVNCTNVEEITIEEGLRVIGGYTFQNCTSLRKIKLPSSIFSVGYCAFGGCKSLEEIFIPKTVDDIESYAFADCPNLTIYCEAEKKPPFWDEEWNCDNLPVVWGYKK